MRFMDQPSPESGGRGEMRDTRVIDYVIAKKSRCFSTFVHICNLIYVSAHKEIYGLGSQSNNISWRIRPKKSSDFEKNLVRKAKAAKVKK